MRKKEEEDLNKSVQRGKGGYSSENTKEDYDRKVSAIDRDNTRFVKDQAQITKSAIEDQDVIVRKLDVAVGNLHEQATVIKEEATLQNKMLDNLENDLDDAGLKMGVVMGSLSKLLKTKDGCQIWTIVILAVILIILVALIIWV